MLNVVLNQIESSKQIETGLEDLDLHQLLEAWEDAKTIELTANARRAAIEAQLSLQLVAPDEGEKSHRIGPFKVTRKNAVYYKGNLEQLRKLTVELEIAPLWKDAIDETAIKRLKRQDSYNYELLVGEGAISTSVAKPNFVVVRMATAAHEAKCLIEVS